MPFYVLTVKAVQTQARKRGGGGGGRPHNRLPKSSAPASPTAAM